MTTVAHTKAYQARHREAGLCRQCPKPVRLRHDGRPYKHCADCAAKAYARTNRNRQRRERGAP